MRVAKVVELAAPQVGVEARDSAGVTQWRERNEYELSAVVLVFDIHGYQTLSSRPAKALGKMA